MHTAPKALFVLDARNDIIFMQYQFGADVKGSLNRCDSLLLLTQICAHERTTEEYRLPGGK